MILVLAAFLALAQASEPPPPPEVTQRQLRQRIGWRKPRTVSVPR